MMKAISKLPPYALPIAAPRPRRRRNRVAREHQAVVRPEILRSKLLNARLWCKSERGFSANPVDAPVTSTSGFLKLNSGGLVSAFFV
jgi:hypothetical protein